MNIMLTSGKLAAFLGISKWTLRNHIRAGLVRPGAVSPTRRNLWSMEQAEAIKQAMFKRAR